MNMVNLFLLPTVGLGLPLFSLALAALLYWLIRAVFTLYLSPLRHIPGPWYAAVSDIYFLSCVVRLRQSKIIHGLFETYGPIVRIGPNRVAFNDVAGLKSVYSVGRFDKGPFYRTGSWVKGFQAFSILEHAPHSARRKIVAPHYTPDNMRSFEPEIQAIVGTMLSVCVVLQFYLARKWTAEYFSTHTADSGDHRQARRLPGHVSSPHDGRDSSNCLRLPPRRRAAVGVWH